MPPLQERVAARARGCRPARRRTPRRRRSTESAEPYPKRRFCSSVLNVYSAIGSVAVPGPPPVITYTTSNTRNASSVRNRNATSRAGREQRQSDRGEAPPRRRAVDRARLRRAPRSIFCRPASSRTATNGVVFHTSASTSGTQAANASANHVGGSPSARSTMALATPAGLSNMKRQTRAATTVGTAHGSRTAGAQRARRARTRRSTREREHQAEHELERHGRRPRTAPVWASALRNAHRRAPRGSSRCR